MPDRRERYLNEEETLRILVRGMLQRVWTNLHGTVDKYPGSAGHPMTVDVQPGVNMMVRLVDGSIVPIKMPLITDCPILWQGGGGVTATFPIAKGDDALVMFSARCIDAWYQQGLKAPGAGQAVNPAMNPPSLRMHNLSDGFALVGLKTLPDAYAIDPAAASLQSDDGSTYVKLNPTAQTLALLAPGGITANGVTIDSSGNVVTAGDVTSKGKVLASHVHTGVSTGGSDTGPPA